MANGKKEKVKTDRQGRVLLPPVSAQPPRFDPRRGHVPFGARAQAAAPKTEAQKNEESRARGRAVGRAVLPAALRPGDKIATAMRDVMRLNKK